MLRVEAVLAHSLLVIAQFEVILKRLVAPNKTLLVHWDSMALLDKSFYVANFLTGHSFNSELLVGHCLKFEDHSLITIIAILLTNLHIWLGALYGSNGLLLQLFRSLLISLGGLLS